MVYRNHTVKLDRARDLSAIGRYPCTWQAIIDAMPPELIRQCTAKQIASIADTMRGQHEIGRSTGYDEATE